VRKAQEKKLAKELEERFGPAVTNLRELVRHPGTGDFKAYPIPGLVYKGLRGDRLVYIQTLAGRPVAVLERHEVVEMACR
jgi:hypothetical protein